MKKVLSILASTTLIASTAFSVTSCQPTNQPSEEEKPIFPFPEYPTNVDEIQELIGYYYDLSEDYINAYWDNDYPMQWKESENMQKGKICTFIASMCFEYIGYELGQTGGFHFTTPKGRDYYGFETNKDELAKWYKTDSEQDSTADWTKDELTRWYNWTLKFEK